MDSPRFKREFVLYGLAFLLAVTLRLIRLGAFPLTDPEAAAALQALDVVRGLREGIGPHSLYVLLTGAFFFAFDSTNFFARLAPALTGSLLVFAPMLFQHRLKPRTSLILAFFLALDPGLLALSRQAGSAIFAVTFLLFAWGFWERGYMKWAGISAALALLGGPAFWPGLLGLGLTWAILQAMNYRSADSDRPSDLRGFGLAFLAALVLFGTFFFLVPAGLGGIFDGLTEYLRNWTVSSNVLSSHLYLSLLFYQPLTVLFALVGIIRGWMVGSRRVTRLSIWLLVAILLAVFYPGRQVHDLVWALIPLSALAALELSRHLDVRAGERLEVLGVTALTFIILIFAWLDLASLAWSPAVPGQANLRLVLFMAAILLLAVSLLLVSVGWSIRSARFGAVWGVSVVLTLFTLSAGMGAGHIRVEHSAELWDAGPYPAHADLLAATVDQLSQWGTGSDTDLPVTVLNLKSPALMWALHRHEVTVVGALDASTSPAILITPLQGEPALAAAYRGQDFTWNQVPTWQGGFDAWLQWLVTRNMPQSIDTILVWGRADLFLDSTP